MSTTPLDLPTLIAQMPHVAKITQADRSAPEVQKQLFGPLIQEQLRKKEGTVQQVNKKERTSSVDRDGQQQQKQQMQKKKKRQEKDVDDEAETGYSDPSPWAGNIVNMKI